MFCTLKAFIYLSLIALVNATQVPTTACGRGPGDDAISVEFSNLGAEPLTVPKLNCGRGPGDDALSADSRSFEGESLAVLSDNSFPQ